MFLLTNSCGRFLVFVCLSHFLGDCHVDKSNSRVQEIGVGVMLAILAPRCGGVPNYDPRENPANLRPESRCGLEVSESSAPVYINCRTRIQARKECLLLFVHSRISIKHLRFHPASKPIQTFKIGSKHMEYSLTLRF